MYDIFLSYSTTDRERLVPLFHALEQQGWSVFWDHRTIEIGEHWNRKIDRAIRACKCVVVVWSAASVESDWVLDEANIGRVRNILLPIQLEEVIIPVGFTMRQTGNFMGWNGKADHPEFVRLCNQIRTFVGEKAAVAPVASAPIITQPPKPAWASTAGDDQYGHYADLNVKGVIQRFRQIKPGTFLMGSLLSEEGRFGSEIQHEVTLTQGFWLADTACTQALWQAVMGNNPAYFQDNPNNPVEKVSWDDVQVFIQKLNVSTAGLARLPTEAEWEYACRAGTTSRYSFGKDITAQQVNFDRNKGQTVPVKSLPANPWGLYEMHGNVWEWCQDWYGEYPAEPVKDPQGVSAGVERVIRGGSWGSFGGSCRSAYRGRRVPDVRLISLGFRLVLGH
jgi:hypothetical protein